MTSDMIQCAKRRLCDDLYDAELVYCQKTLDAAGLSLGDVEIVIDDDSDRLLRFGEALVRAEKAIDVGQDFDVLEEPSNEAYVRHSLMFLLTCSIAYILLRDDRAGFVRYLEKCDNRKRINIKG
ncbi:hypothetical protein WKR88_26310 [Trinickia caryophylli]|uniref:hypothetical protein n=1 Tax=Trinickia caryophylli TaxID=28094 RepID=UPI000A169E9E|nr:hypothetical protein [Trinickia caryophylli]TRX15017.1 hypothetical protein FNF07_27835 [Trinickia caryophylli]WQE14873.1 hypothetical protein U0034_20160 [Trinickia caryophylli]GLU35767.1 hypothetical protein Busp01_56090 [Trinickia caryophylli]